MTREIIFHIGTPKTASTHLQAFCLRSRQRLKEAGIDYVHFGPNHKGRSANGEFLFRQGLVDATIREVIEQSPCDKILISEETLFVQQDIILREAFAGFRKTILVYIRPPVDFIASWAGEMGKAYNFFPGFPGNPVRGNGVMPVEDAISFVTGLSKQNFRNLLDLNAGHDDISLIIRPFERESFIDGDVLADFLQAVGADLSILSDLLSAARGKKTNEAVERKSLDVAAFCALATKAIGAQDFYDSNLVSNVERACKTGDNRKLLYTLTDNQIAALHLELKPLYDELSALNVGFGGFAKGDVPGCYGDGRPVYQPLDPEEVKRALATQLINRGFRGS